jgi:hypothetical protein
VTDLVSHLVEARFTLVDRDDEKYNRKIRILLGRFHDEGRAVGHAQRCEKSLATIPWIRDVVVDVATVWHLQSGAAAAQLVRDIYRYWGERQESRA